MTHVTRVSLLTYMFLAAYMLRISLFQCPPGSTDGGCASACLGFSAREGVEDNWLNHLEVPPQNARLGEQWQLNCS